MRHWSLALLVSLATPALAQDAAPAPEGAPPEAPAPAAEGAAKVEAPPPAPAAAPTATEPEASPREAESAAAPPAAGAAPARKTAAPAPRKQAAPPPRAAEAPTPPPAGSPPAGLPPGILDLKREPVPDTPALSPEEQIRRDIQADARFLFQNLLTGDVRTASNEVLYPFSLESERYATPEELVAAWVRQLRLKRTDLVTLYDIEVMPLDAMEKKYGKAPARLGLDLRNPKEIWTAVGNLSGRAAVLVYRRYRDEFRAFAYTD